MRGYPYDPIYDSLQDELESAYRDDLITEARDVADKIRERMTFLSADAAWEYLRDLWQHRGWEREGMVDAALEQLQDSGGVVDLDEPLYRILTWDACSQAFTPHDGIPEYVRCFGGLRQAVRLLRKCGYTAHRRGHGRRDNDYSVSIERVNGFDEPTVLEGRAA